MENEPGVEQRSATATGGCGLPSAIDRLPITVTGTWAFVVHLRNDEMENLAGF